VTIVKGNNHFGRYDGKIDIERFDYLRKVPVFDASEPVNLALMAGSDNVPHFSGLNLAPPFDRIFIEALVPPKVIKGGDNNTVDGVGAYITWEPHSGILRNGAPCSFPASECKWHMLFRPFIRAAGRELRACRL
jgi:hypothetical protein